MNIVLILTIIRSEESSHGTVLLLFLTSVAYKKTRNL